MSPVSRTLTRLLTESAPKVTEGVDPENAPSAVSQLDIWLILGLGLGVIAVVILLFKEFLFMSFDEEMAGASGLPVQALYFLLLGLMALSRVTWLLVFTEEVR